MTLLRTIRSVITINSRKYSLDLQTKKPPKILITGKSSICTYTLILEIYLVQLIHCFKLGRLRLRKANMSANFGDCHLPIKYDNNSY